MVNRDVFFCGGFRALLCAPNPTPHIVRLAISLLFANDSLKHEVADICRPGMNLICASIVYLVVFSNVIRLLPMKFDVQVMFDIKSFIFWI